MVNVPTKLIKPRRFNIIIEMRGVTWRRIQVEIPSDEAGIASDFEFIEPPQLKRLRTARSRHAHRDCHE